MATRILNVDDNAENRYLLESLLRASGFEVISAENGKDALEKAQAQPPDLIVSDILMPVMDGYALCRAWKSDEKLRHIPFVFYTATYTEPKDKKFALSLGAERFLLKPQEPDLLIKIFKEVLEDKNSAKQPLSGPLGEEMEYFRQYNEILFRKLEKKMSDLETANRELRVLEERYRLNFENVIDVIFTIDPDLIITSMSPSAERLLGYKPEDFIGRSAADLGNYLAPDSFEKAITNISLILKGQIMPGETYEFVASDGTVKYSEISGAPIMRSGRIIGVSCVARDITERKKAEDAKRESEKKYRELYDFLPIPVYEMDFESNITSANRAIYETFGGTEEDFKKGFKAWRLLTPEAVEKSVDNIQKLLRGEQVGGTEYTLKRLDGSEFPAIVISSLIYDHGKPVGLRGSIIDITDRKQAEEALRESEEKYRLIFEYMPLGHFYFDENGVIVACNDNFVKIIGSSKESLIGLNILKLPDKKMTEAVRKALAGETAFYEDIYHSTTAKKDTPVRAILRLSKLAVNTFPGAWPSLKTLPTGSRRRNSCGSRKNDTGASLRMLRKGFSGQRWKGSSSWPIRPWRGFWDTIHPKN